MPEDIEETGSASENQSGGFNPAWNDFLNVIPPQFHDQVIPELQKWDNGVQERFNNIHSQYESFKPFIDQNISPDHINTALGLVNAIETNPSEVVQALQTYYNLTPQQAQQVQQMQQTQQIQSNNQIDFNNVIDDLDPRIKAQFESLKKQSDTMAQIILNQRQQEMQAKEDAALSNELNTLHAKYKNDKGFDFDEQLVLGLAHGGGKTLENAVQEYYTKAEAIARQYASPPAPTVLGSGGAIPSSKVSTRNMSENDLNKFVTSYLNQTFRG